MDANFLYEGKDPGLGCMRDLNHFALATSKACNRAARFRHEQKRQPVLSGDEAWPV
jgi:hypothetical protein